MYTAHVHTHILARLQTNECIRSMLLSSFPFFLRSLMLQFSNVQFLLFSQFSDTDSVSKYGSGRRQRGIRNWDRRERAMWKWYKTGQVDNSTKLRTIRLHLWWWVIACIVYFFEWLWKTVNSSHWKHVTAIIKLLLSLAYYSAHFSAIIHMFSSGLCCFCIFSSLLLHRQNTAFILLCGYVFSSSGLLFFLIKSAWMHLCDVTSVNALDYIYMSLETHIRSCVNSSIYYFVWRFSFFFTSL